MKRLALILALLSAGCLASAQPTLAPQPAAVLAAAKPSGTIGIDFPTTPVPVWAMVRFPITGLTAAHKPELFVVFPDDASKVTAFVASAWGEGQYFVFFQAFQEGEYFLLIGATANGQFDHAKGTVQVGGNVPGPQPKPDPDPPDPKPDPPDPKPDPAGEQEVLFFHESDDLDNMPLAQRAMITGLAFRNRLVGKGHLFAGSIDRSSVYNWIGRVLPNGEIVKEVGPVKAEYADWYEASKGKPLPVVCVRPKGGGVITCYPLPATETAFYGLLEGSN